MSGSFGEMGNLLAQAQKMQRAMEEAKADLAAQQVQGTAGGGVVQVELNGQGEVAAVRLSDDALSAGREALEELILAALRDGEAKASRLREERMSKVTGGLNLPGMM